MVQRTSNVIDVPDIHFKLHSKTNILNIESVPNNVSLLAVSNSAGLLFSGDTQPEFKVFMVNNLIDIDNICNERLARSVSLPGIPNILACNCNGMMFAVSYSTNCSSFLQIFDVPSLLTKNINILYTIKLAPEENVNVVQILWNPEISNIVAIVLSNGGLGMYNLKDSGKYEVHTIDQNLKVQCGCWSPKGKQIVLGLANGRLQQFKPDLTPAKAIICPSDVYAAPFSTVAIHWLSTYQFAVAFVEDKEDAVPSVFVINAPKGGHPSYINYFDVCYTTGQRASQIYFTHVQHWNILLISSANGIEVGVLRCQEGGETPTWVQYTPPDEARIEMPLTDEKEETYPIGFAYYTSTIHRLKINEKEISAMPMIFVLSTKGQLLSFNFLNLKPDAVDICSPPLPVPCNTELFQNVKERLKTLPTESGGGATSVFTSPVKTEQNFHSTSFSASGELGEKSNYPTHFENSSERSGAIVSSTTTNATSHIKSKFSGLNKTAGGNFGGDLSITGQEEQSQPNPEEIQLQKVQNHVKNMQIQMGSVCDAAKSSEVNKPLHTVLPNFVPPNTTIAQKPQQQRKMQNKLNESIEMETGFLELIIVQINEFNMEIEQLTNLSKGLLNNLVDFDKMRGCIKRLNDLQEIVEQANDEEFQIDVLQLRHFLAETRSIIAECRWKLEKNHNPDLPRIGNNILKSNNQRQLTKVKSYRRINEAQLHFLNQQIDAQWSKFQDSVRRNAKSNIYIPCLDGIYHGMTKLKDSLSIKRQMLNQIKIQLQRNGFLYRIRNANTALECFGVDRTTNSTDSVLSMNVVTAAGENRSKLSNEKLMAVRKFNEQRKNVYIIKPHRPHCVSLKSEVVMESIFERERIKGREYACESEKQQIFQGGILEKTTTMSIESDNQKDCSQSHKLPVENEGNITSAFKEEPATAFSKSSSADFSTTNPTMESAGFTSDANRYETERKNLKEPEKNLKLSSSFTTNTSKIISGDLKSGNTAVVCDSSAKPQKFGLKNNVRPGVNFSSLCVTNAKADGTVTTNTPLWPSFTSTAVSGLAKSSNGCETPLNLSSSEFSSNSNSSVVQNITESSKMTALSMATNPIQVASSKPTSTIISTSTASVASNPSGTLITSLNTKPTKKVLESTSSSNIPTSNNSSSGQFFASATHTTDSFSFGDFSKSLVTTASLTVKPATTSPAVSALVSSAITAASEFPAKPLINAVQPSDFKFSLSSLGTNNVSTPTNSSELVTSTTISKASNLQPVVSTAQMPLFSSNAAGILTSPAFQLPTSATTGVAALNDGARTVYSESSSDNFLTSTVTQTTKNANINNSIAAVPTSVAETVPPSANIFGGFPQTDNLEFDRVASEPHLSGSDSIDPSAKNTPLFGFNVTPMPSNPVRGSIFAESGAGFPKSTVSIFSENAKTTTTTVSSFFGGTTATTSQSIFGGSSAIPVEGGSIFSNIPRQVEATGTGTIFGQSNFEKPEATTAQACSIFGSGATKQAPFGGGTSENIGASSGGSIFSSIAPTLTFSPTKNTAESTGFPAFPQPNLGSPITPADPSAGPFGQGSASVAQSGFGSHAQGSAFSKPLFGAPATFGSPPAFSVQPTFGGAPTFGTQKPFGSFVSSTPVAGTSVFGGGTQKNNLFETLGSSNTSLSFGNLAQGANTSGPKPPFGGSSFTNYRS